MAIMEDLDRWRHVVTVARWVLAQPILKVALSVAALSSAATMGALMSVGLTVFPVIDAGQLFIQLAVYVTLTLLAASAATAIWRVLASQSEPMDEGLSLALVTVQRLLRTKDSYRSLRKFAKGTLSPDYQARWIRLFTAATVVTGVVAIILLALRPPAWLRALVGLESFRTLVGLIAVTAVFAVLVFKIELPKRKRATVRFLRSVKKYALTGLQLLLLALSFTAGTVWVEYLRDLAPSVTVEYDSPDHPAEQVSLAVAARDGYLVFSRSDGTPRFIPTDAIDRIDFAANLRNATE